MGTRGRGRRRRVVWMPTYVGMTHAECPCRLSFPRRRESTVAKNRPSQRSYSHLLGTRHTVGGREYLRRRAALGVRCTCRPSTLHLIDAGPYRRRRSELPTTSKLLVAMAAGGNDRADQPKRSQRHGNQIIAERPAQILQDNPSRAPRQANEPRRQRQVLLGQDNVRRLARHVRATGHRNTQVGFASAGASFTPSPTIATRMPCSCHSGSAAPCLAARRPPTIRHPQFLRHGCRRQRIVARQHNGGQMPSSANCFNVSTAIASGSSRSAMNPATTPSTPIHTTVSPRTACACGFFAQRTILVDHSQSARNPPLPARHVRRLHPQSLRSRPGPAQP